MTERSLYREVRDLLRPRTRWRTWRQSGVSVVPRLSGRPLDFVDWSDRVGSSRNAGFPERWSDRTDIPIPSPSRVAVVVHVFYPELVAELLEHLTVLPVPYDLLITNASGEPLEITVDDEHRRNVRVFDVDNHGRDILPTVGLVNAGLLDPYALVLKVHTKRSQWRQRHDLEGDGSGWRTSLLEALLGTRENVVGILNAFAERAELGMVTADGSVLGPEYWGGNEGSVANLLRRIELKADEDRLRFAAGSMYWTRGFVLQGLRALNLTAVDFEKESGQVNVTTAHAVERALGVLVDEAGLMIEERGDLADSHADEGWKRFDDGPLRPRARIIPFYLPQFHPIPENDRWWGEGFTEWTNVTAAQPVYRGHYQPRLPRELGFYDLRLDSVRARQRQLSASAGIEGFMYYHYWFAGRPMLERPIEDLHRGDLDQPFCVMWANENWTRRWDGRESDVLVGQNYDEVPAERFIDNVLPLLADDRYLTIDGRKVLAVYRPGQMKDFPHVVASWRETARTAGLGDLYVLSVDVHTEFDGLVDDVASSGLDGSLGFPPHNHHLAGVPHKELEVDPRFLGTIFSYGEMARHAERQLRTGIEPTYFPGVMVAFDNTARRQWASDIWYGSNPYTFRRWLATAARAVQDRSPSERVVFINAWNEWAEGAVLEPNDRFGATYLLAVRDVAFG